MKTTTEKKYRFFYHFNKQMTNKSGNVKWSIHFKGRCIIVDYFNCYVCTESKSNKVQPKAVVRGFCKDVVVTHNENGTVIASIY